MDYLLSDEAQNLAAAAYLLPGRSDIQCKNRANVSEIPVLAADWDWLMNNSSSIAARLIRICK
jgi:iron(III) transport system substrate-binding protein